MFLTTPVASAFRAYTGGGSRGCVLQVNDDTAVQSFKGNGLASEQRPYATAPQNYGFTSVCLPATLDQKTGKILDCAESWNLMAGAQRAMHAAGIMDDARHRLFKLKPGWVAMFSQRDHGQQFLFHDDGVTLTGNEEKSMVFKLVKNKNKQSQQQQSQQQQANGVGGQSGSGQQTQKKQMGQESLHEEKSNTHIDMSASRTDYLNAHHKIRRSSDVAVEVNPDDNVYLGGLKEKHKFAKVMTEAGPSKNVYARIE